MKKVLGPEDTIQMKKQSKTNKKKKSGKKQRREDWSFKVIIISLLIILVPTILLGFSIYRAYRSTGRPIVGQRFVGDLAPSLEKKDLKILEDKFSEIEGVKAVDLNLKTATLRVYLEMDEDVSKDAFASKLQTAEEILYSLYDKEQYFTAEGTKLQYDFEMYAHRLSEEDPIILTHYKTSRMDKAMSQFLSEPVSEEMAEDLREREKAREEEASEEKDPDKPDIQEDEGGE